MGKFYMGLKHDEFGTSKVGEGDDIGNVADKSGCLGKLPDASSEFRIDSLSTSRTFGHEPNTVGIGNEPTARVTGKIARQLIEETEKQLAYHKEQVEVLERRLQELNQIPEANTDSN
jgi:hypothetical protein